MKRNGLVTDGTTKREFGRDKQIMLKVNPGNWLHKLRREN